MAGAAGVGLRKKEDLIRAINRSQSKSKRRAAPAKRKSPAKRRASPAKHRASPAKRHSKSKRQPEQDPDLYPEGGYSGKTYFSRDAKSDYAEDLGDQPKQEPKPQQQQQPKGQPADYEELGVAPESPQPDVRKAYLKMAMRYHPDKCPVPEKPMCETKMKKINSAYHNIVD